MRLLLTFNINNTGYACNPAASISPDVGHEGEVAAASLAHGHEVARVVAVRVVVLPEVGEVVLVLEVTVATGILKWKNFFIDITPVQ